MVESIISEVPADRVSPGDSVRPENSSSCTRSSTPGVRPGAVRPSVLQRRNTSCPTCWQVSLV